MLLTSTYINITVPSPPLSLPPSLPLSLPLLPHTVLPAQPASIDAVSTTTTSAVLDVQLSVVGTPPLVVVMVLTSHPELGCCDNMTSYQRGDSVRFSLQGLSPDTTYSVNVFAVNLAGQGNGRQVSFSTGQ